MVERPPLDLLNGPLQPVYEALLQRLHEDLPAVTPVKPTAAHVAAAKKLRSAYKNAGDVHMVTDADTYNTNVDQIDAYIEHLRGARAVTAALAGLPGAGGAEGGEAGAEGEHVEAEGGFEQAMAVRNDPHLTALGRALDRFEKSNNDLKKSTENIQKSIEKLEKKMDRGFKKVDKKVDKFSRRLRSLRDDVRREREVRFKEENRVARKKNSDLASKKQKTRLIVPNIKGQSPENCTEGLAIAAKFDEIPFTDLEALCKHYGLINTGNQITVCARVCEYINGSNLETTEVYAEDDAPDPLWDSSDEESDHEGSSDDGSDDE